MNFLKSCEMTGDFIDEHLDNWVNKFNVAEKLCEYACDKIHILS